MADVETIDNVEWVKISHPDIDAEPATVTRAAYDEVYADKGWELADDKRKAKASADKASTPKKEA